MSKIEVIHRQNVFDYARWVGWVRFPEGDWTQYGYGRTFPSKSDLTRALLDYRWAYPNYKLVVLPSGTHPNKETKWW